MMISPPKRTARACGGRIQGLGDNCGVFSATNLLESTPAAPDWTNLLRCKLAHGPPRRIRLIKQVGFRQIIAQEQRDGHRHLRARPISDQSPTPPPQSRPFFMFKRPMLPRSPYIRSTRSTSNPCPSSSIATYSFSSSRSIATRMFLRTRVTAHVVENSRRSKRPRS